MKDAKVFPIFSKPIYLNNIDYEISKIYPELEKIKWECINIDSNEQFSSASLDKKILDKKPYEEIRKHIEEHFKNYVSNILEWDQEFKITTSWLTKTLYDQRANYHNHNNCMYSGVLYLKTPKERAKITFVNHETKRFSLIPKKENMLNNLEFFINTLPGDIVIFPSEVFHKININKSHEERISLAFNFIPVGKIGRPTADSYCEIQPL